MLSKRDSISLNAGALRTAGAGLPSGYQTAHVYRGHEVQGTSRARVYPRILVCLVIYAPGQVSREHLLLSRHPCHRGPFTEIFSGTEAGSSEAGSHPSL